MLSKSIIEKYIMIGGLSSVENQASFEKVYLDVSQDGKSYQGVHFGLYRCFTCLTQHTYGTEQELLFILGVMSTHKNDMETNIHNFYKKVTEKRKMCYCMAEKDAFEEMKRIALLEGVNINAKTYDEAYDKYFDHNSGKFLAENYFYWYKQGKILLHECEMVVEENG